MADRKVCDRCGKEIKSSSDVRYAGVSIYKYEGRLSYELCSSCANRLRKWLNGKKAKCVVKEDNDNGDLR